jgi:8-oxo-dGTP diphosphatase
VADETYNPRDFPPFAVTVDVVVLTVLRQGLAALLIRRGKPPFQNSLALPGGFVQPDEDLPNAAIRELREETGIEVGAEQLIQLGAWGAPDRDERMRVVSIGYLAAIADLPPPRAGSDADDAELHVVSSAPETEPVKLASSADFLRERLREEALMEPSPLRSPEWIDFENEPVDFSLLLEGPVALDPADLAFDHAEILEFAKKRLERLIEETPLATSFCPPTFTLAELRQVYEAIWGVRLDAANFRKRVLMTPGFVVPTSSKRLPTDGRGRLAETYVRGPATELVPPLRRPGTYFRD